MANFFRLQTKCGSFRIFLETPPIMTFSRKIRNFTTVKISPLIFHHCPNPVAYFFRLRSECGTFRIFLGDTSQSDFSRLTTNFTTIESFTTDFHHCKMRNVPHFPRDISHSHFSPEPTNFTTVQISPPIFTTAPIEWLIFSDCRQNAEHSAFSWRHLP